MLSKAVYSILLPSNVTTDFKNFSGLFMTYTAFFHTFSRGSLGLIFSPINVNTALEVTITISGGVPKFFISVICPFLIQLTADSAAFKAGTA